MYSNSCKQLLATIIDCVLDCSVDGHEFETQHDSSFPVHCKVIALLAFYDGITGPTEFIVCIVNSVKMVDMPLA